MISDQLKNIDYWVQKNLEVLQMMPKLVNYLQLLVKQLLYLFKIK